MRRGARIVLALLPACCLACGIDTDLGTLPLDSGPDDVAQFPPRPDAGSDIGTSDVTLPDTGPRDAGAPDGGETDVGPTDVGVDAPMDPALDASPPTECPLDGALQACLLFDGSLTDSSGEGHGAVPVVGRPVTYRPGRSGMAVNITPGLRLILPRDSSLVSRPFTLEAWFLIDAYPSVRGSVADKEGHGSIFVYEDGTVRGSGWGTVYTTEAISTGVWYHAAVVEEPGEDTVFFLNGERAGSASGPPVTASTQPWHIGHNDNTGAGVEDAFPGAIDSLRIWSRALSDEEIRRAAGL